MSKTRILRIPLPVELIREMDELVEGNAGGLESRAEFAREAIEAMVLELQHGVFESPSSGVVKGDSRPEVSLDGLGRQGAKPVIVFRSEAVAAKAPAFERATTLMSIEETALPEPPEVSYFCRPHKKMWRYTRKDSGMHNRDYPSLWAASKICEMSKDGPILFEDAIRQILPEAWIMGERLMELDEANKQKGKARGAKLSALFPTNKEKRKQAEENFAYFAIGWEAKNDSGQLLGDDATLETEQPEEWEAQNGSGQLLGPLPDWKVIGFENSPDGMKVGMTEVGVRLLKDLVGLTVVQPHPPEMAQKFFDCLKLHTPVDWIGFITLMKSASQRHRRHEMVEVFANQWPDITATNAESHTAGYVARGREWGLVEMEMQDKCYVLTDFGESVLVAEQERKS